MTVISMSHKELHRLRVVMDLVEERLTAAEAAAQLHLTERQVWRLRRRFLQDGAAGLASRKRGRASNRRFHPSVQMTAVALVRQHYADFGRRSRPRSWLSAMACRWAGRPCGSG